MEKKDIIEFFDRCAPTWDAEMVKSDQIISKILDNAEVGADMEILDVVVAKAATKPSMKCMILPDKSEPGAKRIASPSLVANRAMNT